MDAHLVPPSKLKVYSLVGMAIVLWASSFVAIREAVHSYEPQHLALLRSLVASLALAVAAPFFHVRMPRLRDLPAFVGMGFVGIAFYLVALNTGEITVTAAGASLIIASETVFVALLAGAFLKERVPAGAWIGFGLSLLGVALINNASAGDLRLSPGVVWIATAAFAAAVLTVWQKAYVRRYTPFEVSAFCVWTGTALLLFAWPGLSDAVAAAPPAHTAMAVYLGVGPAAFGYTVWTYALKYTDASVLSAALYLTSPLTVLIAWLFLGELPAVAALVGGGIILAGVWIAGRRGKRSTDGA